MTQSNLLSEVPSGNYFKFSDGREAKSLEELYTILSTSAPTVFSEHVNDTKNDFADWIRNCVLHVALADKLAPVKNSEEYFRILSGEITNLKMTPADNGLDSIDAELNSVLDEEILAAMNDSDVPVPTAQPTTSPPTVRPIASEPVISQPVMSTIAPVSPAAPLVEESFEFEEVFKTLLDELSKEVFTWEV